MAGDKKPEGSGFSSPLPLALIMTILASFIFDQSAPYLDERPSTDPLTTTHRSVQDVDARLWQDPFAAIEKAGDSGASMVTRQVELNRDGQTAKAEISVPTSKTNLHNADQIFPDFIRKDEQSFRVLAVTLPGGPYPEEAEQRKRRRYAVLSGLANQRWAPYDEQHLGYFLQNEASPQKKVPFEWWYPPSKSSGKPVLLLWVDESSLRGKPILTLNNLVRNALHSVCNLSDKLDLKVIGPNSSSTLKDMLEEAKNRTTYVPTFAATYYSGGATAAYKQLSSDLGDSVDRFQAYFEHYKLKLELKRLTTTDEELMRILINELKLRRVKANDQIVILSEWDTFYGRAMLNTFEKAWKEWKVEAEIEGKDKAENDKQNEPRFFTYMRGLDGRLPPAGEKKSDAPSSAARDKTDKEASIELPEGQSQKDYLRRLTNSILELNKKNGQGVAAIGILGSDVYDKLMILQALRQHFPHMLFFTTDLDAIYSHPTKWSQTHNLLVATPFGLSLHDELQGTIPPFRDNYQTALFLATQSALTGQSVNIDQIQPLLFEIGRSRPIPLAIGQQGGNENYKKEAWEQSGSIPSDKSTKVIDKITKAIDKITKAIDTYLTDKLHPTIVIFSLVSMACLVNWRVRCGLVKTINQCLENPVIPALAAVVMVLIGIFAFHFNNYLDQPTTEPFYWLEGVSIWPTQALRLFSYCFCVGFFCWGHLRVQRMRQTLQDDFHLPAQPSPAITECKLLFIGSWQIEAETEVDKPSSRFADFLFRPILPQLQFLVKDLLLATVIALLTAYFVLSCLKDVKHTLNTNILIYSVLALLILTTVLIYYVCKRRESPNYQSSTTDASTPTGRPYGTASSSEYDYRGWVDPNTAWQKYLGYCDNKKMGLPGSLMRVLVHSLVFFMLAGILFVDMGHSLNLPGRGADLPYINSGILLISVLASLMLTMWVVDHARLCERLIFSLSKKASRWNPEARAYAEQQAISVECIDEWLDIKFVSQITKTLQPLIWGPVTAVGLMVLARSSAIDDWNIPWSLRIVFTTMFLSAISAEVLLQSGARTARKKAIEQLSNKAGKLLNSNTPNDAMIKRIQVEIENARDLREGAFRPWYEWPLLQAFGGTGALILILQEMAEHWASGQY